MALFDRNDTKPIEGYKLRKAGKRTLGDPGTLPPGYATGNPNVISAGFKAGGITNLTKDFIGRNVSADLEIFQSARRLRARSRDLSLNNPHFIKFLAECEQNIVGENGIQLQAKITGANGKQTATSKLINQRIEEEWRRWGKKGRCTADGGYSFTDLQRMAVRTTACEGENLTKYVYDRALNECAFALQPLDNDQLDDQMMTALGNGNQVRMGVEINDYGRPQAYHVWSGHPADMLPGNRERVVVPAKLVNHLFVRRRPAQRRGYTWASGSLLDLNALDRYEEAVIVAARASAAKFMVITQPEAEGYTGEDDTPGSEQEAAGVPADVCKCRRRHGARPWTGGAVHRPAVSDQQSSRLPEDEAPVDRHRLCSCLTRRSAMTWRASTSRRSAPACSTSATAGGYCSAGSLSTLCSRSLRPGCRWLV